MFDIKMPIILLSKENNNTIHCVQREHDAILPIFFGKSQINEYISIFKERFNEELKMQICNNAQDFLQILLLSQSENITHISPNPDLKSEVELFPISKVLDEVEKSIKSNEEKQE